MKVSIHRSIRWMPEGAYHRTLKAVAEVVEGDIRDLLWDLTIYRYALQRVVDTLWDLEKLRDLFNDKSDRIVWKLTMFTYRKL